ncbi:MAG: hypothetical protein HY019_21020 [Aquabacterium sp.]|uniref:hypothetical protein n=1 Tax=Aquabacterium sp. TaxID=1872578 RepID=UPI0025BD0531|nr:hypothetical protein [Aquabacterium sp.]MBI3384488.1 hypothetical protein [Aquabacterium sp.]
MKKLLISLAITTLAGCATYKPIPENYAGPIATVVDSGQSEDSTKAQIFALTEIDGHGIRDSFGTSHQASYGQGASLRLEITERQVPAHAMKVKIRGSHATGAPIHELASRAAGTFFEVEGVVDFNPQADKRYKVVGTLSKRDSAVWIEDEATHQPVTQKVLNQH